MNLLLVAAVSFAIGIVAYVAMSPDFMSEGVYKRRVCVSPGIIRFVVFTTEFSGAYGAMASFIIMAMFQFSDGLLIRPHPLLWRAVLGFTVVYGIFPSAGLASFADITQRCGLSICSFKI
jgi:phosphatidylserine synthase 2